MVGESDVVLDENIIKKDLGFFPSLGEFASDNFEQIIKADQSTSSTATLYTVPDKRTLFVTSVWVAGEISAATATGTASIALNRGGVPLMLAGIRLDHHAGTGIDANCCALSFGMPIKVNSGEIMQLAKFSTYTGSIVGGFTGFEVSKKLT